MAKRCTFNNQPYILRLGRTDICLSHDSHHYVDYICGYYIDKYLDTNPESQRVLITAVVINLSILAF